MLEPDERKRALGLGVAGLAAGVAWFVGATVLPAFFQWGGDRPRTIGVFVGLAALGAIGGMSFAVRKLGLARDRQWDLPGVCAALLLVPSWLFLLLMAGFLAMSLVAAFSGQPFAPFGG